MAHKVLFDIFEEEGFELVIVGGYVRDTILGKEPSDVDFATSALPEQMLDICSKHSLKSVTTGIKHGTVIIVIDEIKYDVTTYRHDISCDGRHATVNFTLSLHEDLCRRDFTMNAIAMLKDGTIIDPFNGVDDAMNGVVRFVGDPEKRIREDYFRILRWFRFAQTYPQDMLELFSLFTVDVVKHTSKSRVWKEMQKILVNHNSLVAMKSCGLLNELGMICDLKRVDSTNPLVILAVLCKQTPSWDLTSNEHKIINFVRERVVGEYSEIQAKYDLYNGADRLLLIDILKVRGDETDFLPESIPAISIPQEEYSGLKGAKIGEKKKSLIQEYLSAF